jgi:hypothetical protein
MAINAAYVCDTKTDQVVKGRKTFTKEVRAVAFTIIEGPTLSKTKEGDAFLKGTLRAHKFEGDASGLKNFSVKNMNADDIEQSLAVNSSDYLLVQKVIDTDSELKKIKINDMLTLIPAQNGILFNFINDGSNKGGGAQVFKKRHSSGRSQMLHFRTLSGGPNIEITQEENEIEVALSEDISVSGLHVDDVFVLPRLSRTSVADPENGMFVYDDLEHRFYGYAKNRWIPTRHSIGAGPNIEILQGENEVDIKLKDHVEVSDLVATSLLLAPHRNIDEVQNPINGSIVYDNVSERFYGHANGKWIALHAG